MKKILYYIPLFIALLMMLGCSGGSSDPITPGDNTGQQQGNPNLGTLSGRAVDLEGTPQGGVFVNVQLFDELMNPLSAVYHPDSTGPLAGEFVFNNLPLNTNMILKIEHADPTVGRLIGYDRTIRFTIAGHQDLADCVMNNEQLMLGWAAYDAKQYNLSLYHFKRALNTRYADALTKSSSAYTGIGWVYCKRGQDWSGTGPANRGFEWGDALSNFNTAVSNPNDADAYVGIAGTYMTLVAHTILYDPVQYGGAMFIYGFTNPYMDESKEALEKALAIAPDYQCAHDDIKADDLRACLLYNKYLIGESVTNDDVQALLQSEDINVGSMQLLTGLSEIIEFDSNNPMM
jgi:tetratricopeptide (TPR) repeat protein